MSKASSNMSSFTRQECSTGVTRERRRTKAYVRGEGGRGWSISLVGCPWSCYLARTCLSDANAKTSAPAVIIFHDLHKKQLVRLQRTCTESQPTGEAARSGRNRAILHQTNILSLALMKALLNWTTRSASCYEQMFGQLRHSGSFTSRMAASVRAAHLAGHGSAYDRESDTARESRDVVKMSPAL